MYTVKSVTIVKWK